MSTQLSMLLDTNVWLDYYLPWRSGYEKARQLIECALEQNQTLAYAVPSIKDIFYMTAAEYKNVERATTGALSESAARAAAATAWGCVNNMQEIACAVPLDHTDVWVEKDGEQVNGKSIMSLMMLAAGKGSAVKFTAAGEDAEAMLDEISALFERKFDEE